MLDAVTYDSDSDSVNEAEAEQDNEVIEVAELVIMLQGTAEEEEDKQQ